jgi:hypothetical protein
MKRNIQLITAMLFLICTASFAQNKMVTFQVSSPDSLPVHVFGSWNNWSNYPGIPMTLVAPNKYTATISMPANVGQEFLFVNGNGSTAQKEILLPTMPCTNGNAQYTNRVLGASDTAVCYTFKTCNTCTVTPPPPPPMPINVTFQVESPDSLPVAVQGSWNWSSFPGAGMTLVAPNKYAVTLQFMPNTTHEFLFINGNGQTAVKEVLLPSMPCTNGNAQYTNRTLSLGNADTSICFTWKTCNTCTIAPPPTNANVTFQVESPDSTPVFLRGSFNNWNPAIPMTLVSGNKYGVTIPLAKNATYEFKYLNGNDVTYETLLPTMSCTNGNAQYTNRVLALGFNDTTLCNTWSTCNACIIPQTSVPYTFQVENPDSTPVYLFGSWNWTAFPGTPMTSVGGGKYEAVMNLPLNDTTIEFLYVNGNTPTKEVLNPAWSCTNGNGQFTNRKIINTGTTPKTLCNKWASCDSCGQVTPTNINVSFAVQAPDSTPVYVFGSWNNWSNWPGTPMTYNSVKNVYEATIPMLASDTIEYLYVNGNTPTKEALNAADACTNGNAQFTNRMVVLGATDTSFCNIWKTCTPCNPASLANNNKLDISIAVSKNFIQINSSAISQFDGVEIFDIVGKKVFGATKVNANTNIPVSLENGTLYIIRVKSGDDFYKTKAVIK